MPESTPVTPNLLSNALPWPARTPATVVTPGTLRKAAADEMPVGVKPFCDVSA